MAFQCISVSHNSNTVPRNPSRGSATHPGTTQRHLGRTQSQLGVVHGLSVGGIVLGATRTALGVPETALGPGKTNMAPDFRLSGFKFARSPRTALGL